MKSVILKTKEEIFLIKKSCEILSKTIGIVGKEIVPGVSLIYLDKIAEEFIRDNGGIPACKDYCGFPSTLCLSVNDKVVHGIPNNYILREGDIVSVDSGVILDGYFSDCTYSFGVGEISETNKRLLTATKNSLLEGIKKAIIGNTIGDIGNAIEKYIVKEGFYIVKKYCGHGLGKNFHEKPNVLNYGKAGTGEKIQNGMVLAIEPIVGETTGNVKEAKNGWDVFTANGCNSAHFEHTIAIIDNKTEILTTFKYCEL
jgi:methionyl aminopeptidase